jgi:putative tricarboxylic transport membrane protein
MSDRVFGAIFLVLALALFAGASQFDVPRFVDPMGPKQFPRMALAAVAASSLYMLLRPDPNPAWPDRRVLFEIVFMVFVFVAYVVAMKPVGFVAATAVSASLISWRLGSRRVMAPVIGSAISGGIYAVFHLALGLSLAKGPWGF